MPFLGENEWQLRLHIVPICQVGDILSRIYGFLWNVYREINLYRESKYTLMKLYPIQDLFSNLIICSRVYYFRYIESNIKTVIVRHILDILNCG